MRVEQGTAEDEEASEGSHHGHQMKHPRAQLRMKRPVSVHTMGIR